MEERHSDDDLMEQIRLGDEKAAEELIKRYYASILHYCKNHCFDREKAEDLTQETFLKPKGIAQKRAAELLEEVGLGDAANKKIKTFSGVRRS